MQMVDTFDCFRYMQNKRQKQSLGFHTLPTLCRKTNVWLKDNEDDKLMLGIVHVLTIQNGGNGSRQTLRNDSKGGVRSHVRSMFKIAFRVFIISYFF